MAEAIIAGLLRHELVTPEQITGSHPRAARREELEGKYGISVFESNREAVTQPLAIEGASNGLRSNSIIILGGGAACFLPPLLPAAGATSSFTIASGGG